MTEVHLLVTCTKRKTRPAGPALRLRSVEGATIAERMGAWLERLRTHRSESIRVEELYAGDHWSVVRSLAGCTTGSGLPIRVWVCSAGYGLLSWASRIAPYAATFSPGQPDSVLRDDRARNDDSINQAWWELLAQWEGPAPGTPRSVAELVEAFPRGFFVLAVSLPYLQALGADLRTAVARLSDRDRFSVLSAGAGARGEPAGQFIPCSAQLQPLVGGARASLNVRLARLALQDREVEEPRCSVLQARFGELLRRQPRRAASARQSITDEQVKAYIRNALRQNARQRPSPLLSRLRRQNRVCEQGRFVSLFRQVEEERHGT